jgi:hypothetical protein
LAVIEQPFYGYTENLSEPNSLAGAGHIAVI